MTMSAVNPRRTKSERTPAATVAPPTIRPDASGLPGGADAFVALAEVVVALAEVFVALRISASLSRLVISSQQLSSARSPCNSPG
jgi:hypothetical protein